MAYEHNPMLAMIAQHKRILAESKVLKMPDLSPTKAEILRLWPDHTVIEIAERVDVQPSTISRHATELRSAGYVLPIKARAAAGATKAATAKKLAQKAQKPDAKPTYNPLMTRLWA